MYPDRILEIARCQYPSIMTAVFSWHTSSWERRSSSERSALFTIRAIFTKGSISMSASWEQGMRPKSKPRACAGSTLIISSTLCWKDARLDLGANSKSPGAWELRRCCWKSLQPSDATASTKGRRISISAHGSNILTLICYLQITSAGELAGQLCRNASRNDAWLVYMYILQTTDKFLTFEKLSLKNFAFQSGTILPGVLAGCDVCFEGLRRLFPPNKPVSQYEFIADLTSTV